MERSTKIYLGVGAAALIAFFLLRNKAAAQKPTTTGGTGSTSGGTSGGTASGDAPCPDGQVRVQPNCLVAPCPSQCMPVGGSNGSGVDIPVPTDPCMTARLSCGAGEVARNIGGMCACVADDVVVLDPPVLGDTPPVSNPSYGKFPVYTGGGIYDGIDMGGGIAGKVGNQELYL